jgi:hypothetical protein
MKVDLSGSGVLALSGVVAVVAVVGYLGWKFGPKLKTLATKTLNPASSENIVNQGVTAAVSGAVGYDETLGGWISDKVFRLRHPGFLLNNPTSHRENLTIKPLAGVSDAGFGPDPYAKQPLAGISNAGFGPDPYAKKTADGDYQEPSYF